MKINTNEIKTNWQKICAAEDYNNKEFKLVLDQIFEKSASYHRKQWEFVVIYLNLLKNNKIDPSKVGASFGAGREPLIYLVGSQVKQFWATDLYIYDTGWQTAKVNKQQSCRDFVMEKAPLGMDCSGIQVEEMDMRELGFNAESLDFCYSSCAFEHIGHEKDFLAHLNEVKRVLKDDGIYVMTTEYLFMHETIKTEGNYKFDVNYLWHLFEKSGLYPDPEFDPQLDPSLINQPRLELSSISGMGAQLINSMPGMVLEKQGVPYTSCCFVLRKSNKQNINVKSMEDHNVKNFIAKSSQKNLRRMFQKYQFLNPTLGLKKSVKTVMADHIEYLSDDHEAHFKLIKTGDNFIHTDFIHFAGHSCQFQLSIVCKHKANIKVVLIEKPQLTPKGRKKVVSKKVACQIGINDVLVSHQCSPDKVYALAVSTRQAMSDFDLGHVTVKAKMT